jgi:hypothetical protein
MAHPFRVEGGSVPPVARRGPGGQCVGRASNPAALAAAGLPRQRFHDLRHAYATLMLEDGEELATVSRSLGHSNLSTTADVYGHVTPAMRERSAARMDAILTRRSGYVGSEVGSSPESRAPRIAPGGSFVLRRVVGAERFERSTS